MANEKAFVLWSGGKDSHLACALAQQGGLDITSLLTFMDEVSRHSMSHYMPSGLLHDQANLIGIPMFQIYTTRQRYEEQFRNIMKSLRPQGVMKGVFGDIYLEEHRTWIERVCAECDVEPVFPLWGKSVEEIFDQQLAFQNLIVSIRKQIIEEKFLGSLIDFNFKSYLLRNGFDLCGEKGEYHTLVIGSPLMKGTIEVKQWRKTPYDDYIGMDIVQWTSIRKSQQQPILKEETL